MSTQPIRPATKAPVALFQVPQLTALGEFGRLPILPSFFYIPGPYDIDPKALQHPWPKSDEPIVGALARDHGSQVPARLVSSAKSWLCHGNVDRNARILPWGAPAEVLKVSPVQASAAYLAHIRKAWNHAWGNEEERFLENQHVILTVPASFDEVARELTLSAATMAGYRNVTLIEEPLAAFYSWLMRHEKQWQEHVRPNELILICDVGGGTTDFTLITLNVQESGSPRFERIAVGDHLILGGDNVDLALARHVEAQWQSPQGLDTNRWKALCHQCRQAKEQILSGAADSHRITLMGAGSRLIAGTITAELERAAVEQIILEGFFPLTDAAEERPAGRRAAITEFGLPYEPEPAVTRHLHRFLERHRQDVADAVGKNDPLPDLVLFNGGSLKPSIIQERIVDNLVRWFGAPDTPRPRILENRNHDTAVAVGAAYYGLVKAGRGVRVGSGSPRSYYLGVGHQDQGDAPETPRAICLVERGLDEGSTIELGDHQFEVLANQPVRFMLYSSSFRGKDHMGELVTIDDTLIPLPPMQTVIRYGKKGVKTRIPVRIEAEYTEMGTLSLWCRSLKSEHRWQLQFQLRDTVGAADVRQATVLEEALVREARDAVQSAFAGNETGRLDGLVKEISAIVDLPREEWPLSLIRELADSLLQNISARSRSAIHEARWMNLLGFCLRPGFGDALDTERIKQAWKVQIQGAVRPKHAQVQSEWWIMWRRLAGGLTPGQQRLLSQDLGPLLQSGAKGAKTRLPLQRQIELWMTVANLERLYVNDKIKWGRLLLSQMKSGQIKHQHFWSLARIGARELLYGPADRVIPPDEVTQWVDTLMNQDWPEVKAVGAALVQMARKTGDRTRDLAPGAIERIIGWISAHPQIDDQRRYLLEVIPIERQEQQTLFGESLPSGLVLHSKT
jgi:hypothetical protein